VNGDAIENGNTMTEQSADAAMQVVIAGAGPTGLMLACELRLAGVDATVLERDRAIRTVESRAGGLHARTLEILDQRGLADRFLELGRPRPAAHYAGLPLDLADLPTRYPFLLLLMQSEVERLLAERATETGAKVRRGAELTGLSQDGDGVTVHLADGTGIRADYLVGCDGGRSTVRRLARIGFPGTPATMTAMLGDVHLTDPPEHEIFQERREHGSFSVLRFGPDWHRVITNEFDHVRDRNDPVTLEALSATMRKIAGTDFGMHAPRWLSHHGDAARQADRYRDGRVLIAGDAAHIHFPAGGQGLNTGVQDAVNLGWKLAAVVRGQAPDSLLDTYEAERRPVAARVLQNTRAQTALWRLDDHTSALRETMADLIGIDEVRTRLAGEITAIDTRYPVEAADDLLGRRMPDLDLRHGRVYDLLHRGRALLLDFGGVNGLETAVAGWTDRVNHVRARLGEGVDFGPDAVLVRPDGHIAWVARTQDPDVDALKSSLTTWLGPGDALRVRCAVSTRSTSLWALGKQLLDEGFDTGLDLVADGSDGVDALACGVVEGPVEVALPGEDRADVAAAHGDAHVRCLDGPGGEDLRRLRRDVDADFGHGGDCGRVDLVCRGGSGGSDFDAIAREVGEPPGGHLGSSGVVDADEEDGRLGGHGRSFAFHGMGLGHGFTARSSGAGKHRRAQRLT
jgi:2-polyprenyl-6-methoxyphenol hydroxylase-like FAD-dependent oxidoreductase